MTRSIGKVVTAPVAPVRRAGSGAMSMNRHRCRHERSWPRGPRDLVERLRRGLSARWLSTAALAVQGASRRLLPALDREPPWPCRDALGRRSTAPRHPKGYPGRQARRLSGGHRERQDEPHSSGRSRQDRSRRRYRLGDEHGGTRRRASPDAARPAERGDTGAADRTRPRRGPRLPAERLHREDHRAEMDGGRIARVVAHAVPGGASPWRSWRPVRGRGKRSSDSTERPRCTPRCCPRGRGASCRRSCAPRSGRCRGSWAMRRRTRRC